jgi:hypothetical protein
MLHHARGSAESRGRGAPEKTVPDFDAIRRKVQVSVHVHPARDHVIRSHGAELTPLFRILGGYFIAVESLKNAEMALAQVRIGDEFMSGKVGDCQSRLYRPAQIAAVKRRKLLARQPVRQRLRLRDAFFSQPAVEMALTNPRNIPLGLTVANKDNLRALHALEFPQSLLTLIARGTKSTAEPIALQFLFACRNPA